MIEKQGDVSIFTIREVCATKDYFLLWEFFGTEPNAHPMLFGDDDIKIKVWDTYEGNGKPTIIKTPLKWETFDMDDNILVMVKKQEFGFTILITKKYCNGSFPVTIHSFALFEH